jgi:hypothetical protein
VGANDAATLVERVRAYTAEELPLPRGGREWQALDAFADVAAGIDHYTEGLIEAREPVDARLLDIAWSALEQLRPEDPVDAGSAPEGDEARDEG